MAKNELVFASSESDSGYGSGRIVALNPNTMRIKGISDEVSQGIGWHGIQDLKLRDLDFDGTPEVLIATSRTHDGVIEAYKFAGGSFFLDWTSPTDSSAPFGAPFYAVDAADLDGDGDMEIVGTVGREHTGSIGNYAYVYDYQTGLEQGRTLVTMGGYWDAVTEVGIYDADRDGELEIVAMVEVGDIYVHDAFSLGLEAIIPGMGFTSLTWGGNFTVTGDSLGRMQIFDFQAGSYQELINVGLANAPIDGITFVGNNLTMLVGADGRMQAHAFANPAAFYTSENFGAGYGSEVVIINKNQQLHALSGGLYGVIGVTND